MTDDTDRTFTKLFSDIVETFGNDIFRDRPGLISCMMDIGFPKETVFMTQLIMKAGWRNFLESVYGETGSVSGYARSICSRTFLMEDKVRVLISSARLAIGKGNPDASGTCLELKSEELPGGFVLGMGYFQGLTRRPDYRKAYLAFRRTPGLHARAMARILEGMGYGDCDATPWSPDDTDALDDEPDTLWMKSCLLRMEGRSWESRRTLLRSAEAGSCLGMHSMYASERKGDPRGFLRTSAKMGYYPAMVDFCDLKENRVDLSGDGNIPEDVVRIHRMLAERGSERSNYIIGCLHFTGRSVERSLTEAYGHLMACRMYKPDAGTMIGDCIMSGRIDGRSKDDAETYYRMSHDRGDTGGSLKLAEMYLDRDETVEKALDILENLNLRGIREARRLIESAYLSGKCSREYYESNVPEKERRKPAPKARP